MHVSQRSSVVLGEETKISGSRGDAKRLDHEQNNG